MGYNYTTNMLFIRIGKKLDRPVITKRDVLSWISSMYDPLGMICPYVLKGRLYFQLINKAKIGWNEAVPDSILRQFNKWKNGVCHLRNVQIPRWTAVLGMEDTDAKLVLFCDASSIGYGFVAYIRRCLIEGTSACGFSRVQESHGPPANDGRPSGLAGGSW